MAMKAAQLPLTPSTVMDAGCDFELIHNCMQVLGCDILEWGAYRTAVVGYRVRPQSSRPHASRPQASRPQASRPQASRPQVVALASSPQASNQT